MEIEQWMGGLEGRWGRKEEEKWEGKLWPVCKINERIINNKCQKNLGEKNRANGHSFVTTR